MQLKNKTVVITGGSDGLGLALAKALVAKGALVKIIARDEIKLDQAAKQLGANAEGFIADVSNWREVEQVAKKISSIDVLINNAGIWLEGDLEENSAEQISQAIDVNFKGVVFSTKAFLPSLRQSEAAQIINISSTSGLRGRNGQAVYAASKFAVTGFTESLKVDLEKTKIRVAGFYPGGMSTQLFAKAGSPKDNADWMDTSKVAEIIVFMLERDLTMVMDQVVLNKRQTKISN